MGGWVDGWMGGWEKRIGEGRDGLEVMRGGIVVMGAAAYTYIECSCEGCGSSTDKPCFGPGICVLAPSN